MVGKNAPKINGGQFGLKRLGLPKKLRKWEKPFWKEFKPLG